MQIQLLRHATILVDWGDIQILVDPMLAPAESMDPIGNAAVTRRIPMVPLPFTDGEFDLLIAGCDGVFITHTHRDHWDAAAAEKIPLETPLVCQPADLDKLNEAGFTNVITIEQRDRWHGIEVTRTGGQHGTGEMAERLGPVSGFVFKGSGDPTLYIPGDTVWCPEFEDALRAHAPDVIVLNAGAAQFLSGGPITMTADEVIRVAETMPAARVIAVHMETINHCLLSRAELAQAVAEAGLSERVLIPADGERIDL